MNDGATAAAERRTVAAGRLVRELKETSADLRECALLAPDGTELASTAGAEWEARTAEILSAATGEGETPAAVHVATDTGEVFVLRSDSGHVAVAVAARYALESLMLCDLRAALRSFESEA